MRTQSPSASVGSSGCGSSESVQTALYGHHMEGQRLWEASAFPGILENCACCGRDPPPEKDWPRCARCGLRSYCSRQHQVESWKRSHSKTCGTGLPAPAGVRAASPEVLATLLGEFGRASIDLAAACCQRALAYKAVELNDLARADGVQCLLATMEANRTHPALLRPACQLLLKLIARKVELEDGAHRWSFSATTWVCDDVVAKRLIAGGAVAALVSAASALPRNAAHCETCCAALGVFSSVSADGLAAVLGAQALQTIVSTMKLHAAQASVNHACCSALADALAADASAGIRAHAIPAILTAMRTHLRQPQIQAHGAIALTNAARGDAAALDAALQPRGIDEASRVVVDAMRAHLQQVVVQQCGIDALATLVSSASRLPARASRRGAARSALSASTAAAVVTAMHAHETSEEVQRHGSTAIAVLGVHDTACVARAGGARAAILALRAQPNVWEAAWGALHCLAGSSAEGRDAVLHAGGVEVLQEVMESGDPAMEGTATGKSRIELIQELLCMLTDSTPAAKTKIDAATVHC